jgi:hypothetical protein
MDATFSVRNLGLQEWRIFKDLRLGALEDAPDAFERTLAERRNCCPMTNASPGSNHAPIRLSTLPLSHLPTQNALAVPGAGSTRMNPNSSPILNVGYSTEL